MRRLLVLGVLLGLTACGGSGPATPTRTALVVVSAPLTDSPWIGTFLKRGAELAAKQQGAAKVRVTVLDNGGSAQTVAAHARQAVADGASALVIDGVGSEAVAAVTDPVRLPVFVAWEGGQSLVDVARHPTLFRLAPANKQLCRRLADYLADTRPGRSVALIGDDSTYGREGTTNAAKDLRYDEVAIASTQTVPSGASDVAAQVLRARRSGAQVLVVWARATTVAAVLRAARATGWDVPVYTGPAGEDPLVRQRLADHPEWLDGTTFVSFRITSETGPAPFAAYRKAFEAAYGAEQVGVGDVVQPPDWSMYSYDAVGLVVAAAELAGSAKGADVYTALQTVSITGANGDERGYSETDREGVSPDDMYFARFAGMRFAPVTDDKLSTSLPTVPQ